MDNPVRGVGDDADPGVVECVDQARVRGRLPCRGGHRAELVRPTPADRTGRRGRGGSRRGVGVCRSRTPVMARSHTDPIDRRQGAVEDRERRAPGPIEGLVEGRRECGENVDAPPGRKRTESNVQSSEGGPVMWRRTAASGGHGARRRRTTAQARRRTRGFDNGTTVIPGFVGLS